MLIINRSDHDEHERQDDAMNEQMNSTQRPARRKRPHPARRARRVAGAAGVGGMLLMTGFLAVDGSAAAATNPSHSSLTAIGLFVGSDRPDHVGVTARSGDTAGDRSGHQHHAGPTGVHQ